MKGSAKSNSQSTKTTVLVLYVILFLLSITSVSMIQLSMNTSTAYTLNIEYEQHTTTATAGSYSFDHSYSIIIVDISVMVNSYESTLSSIRVGNFPFWVDTSDWTEGETVSISGNLYSIHSQTGKWRAYRSFADFESENLYYHKELGILIESNTDRISSGLSGFSGFSVEINIQHSNIDGFVARVTGSNIVGNIVLLSAIFTEVLIVRWLYTRKHKSRTTKSSK